jgi:hypothetical protein
MSKSKARLHFKKSFLSMEHERNSISSGEGAVEGAGALSIPEGMIANNRATTPCCGFSLCR